MTEKHRKILYVSSIIVFVLFCMFTTWYIGRPMVRFAEEPKQFRLWVDSYGPWGRVIFLGMVVLQVLVAFIPGEAIELAAGYAFGIWEGTILSMLGILIGSCIIFILVRKFGIKIVEVFFDYNKITQLRFLNTSRKTKVLFFLLMFIPGTPKDFLSYFAGLTRLSSTQWLLIVSVARIPSVLMSTVTGAVAGEERYGLAAGMLVITSVISLAGIVYYHCLCTNQNGTDSTEIAA